MPAMSGLAKRGNLRSLVAKAYHRVRDRLRGETRETYFDIYHKSQVNDLMREFGHVQLANDLADARQSVAGARRWILAQLTTRPTLRWQYRRPLSSGISGAFATRLLREVRHDPIVQANIHAAFESLPGERGQRIYEIREDLRTLFPLGPTPIQRGQFLRWFLEHGTHETKVEPEAGLWWLYEVEERPDRGLVGLYTSQPTWQEALPHALTVFGWDEFKRYLKANYNPRGRWFEQATWQPTMRPWEELRLLKLARPELAKSFPDDAKTSTEVVAWLDRQPGVSASPAAWRRELEADFAAGLPRAKGVNVLAHFRYASGLQEAAFGVCRGLGEHGWQQSRRDLPVYFESDWRDRERYQGVEAFDTTIYVAATNTFPDLWYPRAGIWRRPGVERIAVWYWELEQLPPEWVPQLSWADEVWAPTQFIADAFQNCVTVPVVPMLPGLELAPFAPQPRANFGLPDDRCVFLFSFDMGSVMSRKNPLAIIDAYRAAFRHDDRVHLAIKVSRGKTNERNLARLSAACQSIGATLIDKVLTREDTLALLNCADCYVSLHRSEGLGLGMAEMMAMGKPVIATAYSGNIDFMTTSSACLVDYEFTTITEDLSPYPMGCRWAEPSVAHAAEYLRWVYTNPDAARELGGRAKSHIQNVMSPRVAGERMAKRLRERTQFRSP